MGLEGNRQLENDIIVGAFLCGRGDDKRNNFVSLREVWMVYYAKRFCELERISQDKITNLIYALF